MAEHQKKPKIKAQIEKLRSELSELEAAHRQLVLADVRAMVSENKLTVREIFSDGNQNKPPPKYRNDETGETWAGRGRPPLWLTKAIEGGKTEDDFLIR